MIVTCEKCQLFYDDASCWTICPHNPLDRRHDDVLCREHDLFNCPLHGAPEKMPASAGIAFPTTQMFKTPPRWWRLWRRIVEWLT